MFDVNPSLVIKSSAPKWSIVVCVVFLNPNDATIIFFEQLCGVARKRCAVNEESANFFPENIPKS